MTETVQNDYIRREGTEGNGKQRDRRTEKLMNRRFDELEKRILDRKEYALCKPVRNQ